MPTTLAGRELINQYLKENSISVTSLATMLGLGKVYVNEVLTGKKNNAAANELILKIIETLKIRPKKEVN